MKIIILITLLVVLPSLATPPKRAKVFEKGSMRSNLLFTWTRTEKKVGTQRIAEMAFQSLDGKPAAKETMTYLNDRFQRYDVDQLQLKERGFVEVRGTKLHFEYTKDGKTKSDDEGIVDNFVVAPTLVDYLASQREKILKGETVKIRYGVLDRRETVGFNFNKIDYELQNPETTVRLKMKPSSIFISALVDPLFFTLEKTDFRLIDIVGRTLPKISIDGNWKDLDAEVVYFYD